MTEMKTDMNAVRHEFVGEMLRQGKDATFRDCFNHILSTTEIFIKDYFTVKNELERTYKELSQSEMTKTVEHKRNLIK